MGSEFLVIVACLYQKGCTEAAQFYYSTQPELQVVAANLEKKGRKFVGPFIAEYGLPIAAIITKQTGVIRITDNFNVSLSRDNFLCILKWEY